MSSLVWWQRLAQPRHTQTHSLCLCAECSQRQSELSAVAPVIQLCSVMTDDWRVGACMWDVFFFFFYQHEEAILTGWKTFFIMSTSQELCKTGFEGISRTKKSPQPGEEKIGFHMTTEIQYIHFSPAPSLRIYLFICLLSLVLLQASRWKCYDQKKKKSSVFHWSHWSRLS